MKGNCGECERRWFCEIDPDKCDEWPDPLPMTNADRIRAMSDEEMAEFIMGTINCDGYECGECPFCGPVEKILDWLQQPVKEGAD